MGIRDIVKTKAFRFFLQVLMTTIGLFMIVDQAYRGYWAFGDNPWNVRIYIMLAFLLMAGGYAFSVEDRRQKILRFVEAFSIQMLIFFLIGGFHVADDILSGTNFTGRNIWIGFDALSEAIAPIVLVESISNMIVTLVPIGILIFVVVSIFHADQTDEYQSAILEGVVTIVFYLAYAWITSSFGIGF
jgi:hypothetical protein